MISKKCLIYANCTEKTSVVSYVIWNNSRLQLLFIINFVTMGPKYTFTSLQRDEIKINILCNHTTYPSFYDPIKVLYVDIVRQLAKCQYNTYC